jgi:hypothetical protein
MGSPEEFDWEWAAQRDTEAAGSGGCTGAHEEQGRLINDGSSSPRARLLHIEASGRLLSGSRHASVL